MVETERLRIDAISLIRRPISCEKIREPNLVSVMRPEREGAKSSSAALGLISLAVLRVDLRAIIRLCRSLYNVWAAMMFYMMTERSNVDRVGSFLAAQSAPIAQSDGGTLASQIYSHFACIRSK